ncbi:MAG: hypothetical protein H7A45_11810 [Verrucomicrobiales bacterium]|nr:hypothetical protein [Verrucomicrobiales bacterium]MCP5525947.1 hypothetical protein [Verrucomicrobiales bacterium]
MSDLAQRINAAVARIRELDQTDDSGVDYDGWGNATLRHMSSYHAATHIAYTLNAELAREAISVTPRTKEVEFTIYHTVGIDGHMHPGGESQSSGEVVCGFDVVINDA